MSTESLPVKNEVSYTQYIWYLNQGFLYNEQFNIKYIAEITETSSKIYGEVENTNSRSARDYLRLRCNYIWINANDDTNTLHFGKSEEVAFQTQPGAKETLPLFTRDKPVKWLLAYIILYGRTNEGTLTRGLRGDMLSASNTWGRTFKQEDIEVNELIATTLENTPNVFFGRFVGIDFSSRLTNPIISEVDLQTTFAITDVNIDNISDVQITFSLPANRVNTRRDEINIYLLNESNDKYEFVRSIIIKGDDDGFIKQDFSEFNMKKIQLTRFITMGLTLRYETNPISIDFETNTVSQIFVSPNELERIKINSSTPVGVYSPILLYNPVDDKERCVA